MLKEKNRIRLVFSNGIYPIRNIKTAISEYAGLAKFSLKSSSGKTEVTISDFFGAGTIGDEFSNYLLSLCIHDKI